MRALANLVLRTSVIALAGFILSTTAAAQTGLATVTGIVSDESGGAVPGLTVTKDLTKAGALLAQLVSEFELVRQRLMAENATLAHDTIVDDA